MNAIGAMHSMGVSPVVGRVGIGEKEMRWVALVKPVCRIFAFCWHKKTFYLLWRNISV